MWTGLQSVQKVQSRLYYKYFTCATLLPINIDYVGALLNSLEW